MLENVRPTFTGGSRTFDGDMQQNPTIGGLVLLHYDDQGYSYFSNSIRLEVKEADGSDAVGTSVGVASMAHAFPGTTNNTSFNITSTPASNDKLGNPTGLCLTNITNNNGTVSATIDFKVASKSTDVTAYNSSRKLIRVQSGDSVYYHLVYASGGEIYYTKPSDEGASWGKTYSDHKRLSTGNNYNKYPCITKCSGHIYVVWQRTTGTNHAFLFRHSGNSGSSWDDVRTIASSLNQSSEPLPVLVSSNTRREF